MRRIEYPNDLVKLNEIKLDYISYFGYAIEKYTNKQKLSKKCKEYRWQKLKKSNAYLSANFKDISVKDIILADYLTLIEYYEKYQKCVLTPEEGDMLKSIFNYDCYDGKIAEFFISKANELKIHSCFYCETAYINVYSVSGTKKKYFDIDHVIPVSKCPLLALSLFNFVPSCQVCNSRIKGDSLITNNKASRLILSPSSFLYDFEHNVTFRLRPLKKVISNFKDNPNLFEIKIEAKKPYKEEVKFFHLEERYEYHKMEALRLKDLQAKYSRRKILSIAKLLGKLATDVEEDIFNKQFVSEGRRCFRKFILDMLK